MMTKAKRITAILCMLFVMQDFLAHFIGAQRNAWLQWMRMYRAWAAVTRYASTTGSGTACTIGSPCTQSIAVSGASIGDTILFRAGIYPDPIDITPLRGSTGTVTWIGAYQNEIVIIKPTAGQSALAGMYDAPTAAYFVFDDLDLDGGNNNSSSNITAFTLYRSHHITIQGDNGNCKVHHWTNSGMQIFADDNTVQNCEIHRNGVNLFFGTAQDHGAYVGGNRNLFFKNTIHRNLGYALQQYDSGDFVANDNIYDSNLMHTCGGGSHGSAAPSLGALVLYHGNSGSVAKNNIVNGCPYGIATGNGTNGPLIYGNTIFNVEVYAIDLFGSTGAIVRNNVHWGTGTSIGTSGSSGSTQSNNLFGTDPRFADAANGDFRPCTAAGVPHASCVGISPLIAVGAILGPPFNVDFVGSTRPPALPWTIGAYEASGAGSPTCPATPALVAQYGFDGNTVDSSGNSNNGSLGSGVTFATGKYSQAASFTGVGAISVANSLSLWLCDGFTFSGWVKQTNTPTDFTALIVKNYKQFLYSWSSGYCGSGATLGGYEQGPVVTACYATGLTQDVWTYVTLTYDKTNLRLWRDGVNVTSQAATATLDQTVGSLQIGGSEFGEFFTGLIDEVRIYNYARSGVQIIADMNTPIGSLTAPVALRLSGGSTLKFGPGVVLKMGNH